MLVILVLLHTLYFGVWFELPSREEKIIFPQLSTFSGTEGFIAMFTEDHGLNYRHQKNHNVGAKGRILLRKTSLVWSQLRVEKLVIRNESVLMKLSVCNHYIWCEQEAVPVSRYQDIPVLHRILVHLSQKLGLIRFMFGFHFQIWQCNPITIHLHWLSFQP